MVCTGCRGGAAPELEPDSTLSTERTRWESAALADYRYDFQQQCFCVREQVQPVTIEVRDGRISRVVSRESGAEITGMENLRWYTIPDLFGVVSEAQESGIEPLVVRYDSQYGYPSYIEAGTLANDAGVVYTASNLQPLVQ